MKKKAVFIDTNVYFKFFDADSVDLNSLEELLKLLNEEKVCLILPQQVAEEYRRNLSRIKEAELEKLQTRATFDVPTISKDRQDFTDAGLRSLKSQFRKIVEENSKKLEKHKKALSDLKNKFDKLEVLIGEIFVKADKLDEKREHYEHARIRYLKGNPPQKYNEKGNPTHNESYGDAIIWEVLLSGPFDRLAIISHDADYQMSKKDKRLNEMLEREWASKRGKRSKISLFDSLGSFINRFAKKKIITEEVIKKEKAEAPSYYGSTVVYPGSSVFTATSPFTGTTVFTNLATTGTASGSVVSFPINSVYTSGSTVSRLSNLKCKKCGQTYFGQEGYLVTGGSLASAISNSDESRNVCPYCGNVN